MKLVKAAGFSSSPSWEGRKGPQTLSFQDIALLKAVLAAGLYDSVGKIDHSSRKMTKKLNV